MRTLPLLILLLLTCLGGPALARPAIELEGRFVVRGVDRDLGAYRGSVEVQRQGARYRFKGAVRYAGGAEGRVLGEARWGRDGRILVRSQIGRSERAKAGAGRRVDPSATKRLARLPKQSRRGEARFRVSASGELIGAFLAEGVAGERVGVERWERPTLKTVRLKVMTFNVLGFKADWLEREGRVAAVIAEEKPDLVCLQEVVGITRGTSLQVKRLAKKAGGYHHTFEGARSYTGRAGLVWLGNAILSRGPIKHRGRLALPNKSGKYARALAHARVEVARGVTVDVISLHLHQERGEAEGELRLEQGRALLRFLRELPPKGLRLVAGDFNERPDGKLHALLTGKGHLLDSYLAAHPDATGGAVGATSSSGKHRIDYLFWQAPFASGGKVKVNRAWVRRPKAGEPLVSDHRPVFSEVELRVR